MSDLVPKLKKIKVQPEKLYLDPNNPRLITRDNDTYDISETIDRVIQTRSKISDSNDSYKIKELENSIKQNGWWPIDFIFVKKLDDNGRYLVLEGNRRVTAIQNIRQEENVNQELKSSLNEIEVMEILEDCSPEQLQKKITYLLGVRHHGSLKPWTPFAQANNIYLKYLELGSMDKKSFKIDAYTAEHVANALSIDVKEVEERLRVFRAMQQLDEYEPIKNSDEGKIEDRYYSVCQEVLTMGRKELKNYIRQDNENYELDEESLKRMNNLCFFDKANRNGAPISNPQEWRKLANILKDEDEVKRQDMLYEVEVNHIKPSIVWAERAAELQTLQWDTWLNKVSSTIKRVTLGEDLNSDAAKVVTKKLINLLQKLDKK